MLEEVACVEAEPLEPSEQLVTVVPVVPVVSVVPVVPVVLAVPVVSVVPVLLVPVPVSVDGAFVEALEGAFVEAEDTLAALGAAETLALLLGGKLETPLEVGFSQEHSEV